MQIAGSSAIVVGGAGGLGEATVRRLHAAGAKVVVADLADDKGKALESELGVRYVPTDATSEESVNAAIAEAASLAPLRISVDTHGGPASGGRLIGKDGSPLDLDGFKKTIEFYLTAVFNVMRLSAAEIAKSEPLEEGARGVIVNTASIAGYEGQIGQLPYSAAKGGVLGMTLVAARDLSPLGIRVVTDRARHHQHPGVRQGGRPTRAVLGSAGAVPQANGPIDGVRAVGAEHHRKRLSEWRDHPPRRRAAVPAEMNARRQGGLRRRRQPRHRRDGRRGAGPRGSGGRRRRTLRARGQGARHDPCRRRSHHVSGRPGTGSACDVTSEESVEAAVAETVSEFGGIDILVANAGVLWLGPIESTPLKRWQLCMNVNLTGVFLVTKAVIPHVRARGGGSLIAITTTGVGMIEHGSNAYWVSKAGAERLYLGLAADLKPDNIAVNCLSPSRVVLTEGWQAGGGGMEIPPEMVEPPEAMANAAVLLAQQDASGITGTIQRSEELTF